MAYLAQNSIDSWQVNFKWSPQPAIQLYEFVERADRGMTTPVTREQVPLFAVTTSKRRTLPDFILMDATMGVSRKVRDHIQKLEPGRNQYIPFTPLGPGRRPWLDEAGQAIQYYFLHVTERFDAIDLERSAPCGSQRPEIYRVVPSNTDYEMHSRIIGDHHVWGGIWQMPTWKYFSDTLVNWIVENKMKGIELTHIRENDR